MDDSSPLDPALLTQLDDYARHPRGPRSTRTWTFDELALLLDASVSVTEVMARLDIGKRATVTYELVRMRRAGLPVPQRPSVPRSPQTLALEADLRAGMTDTEATRTYGVFPTRAREVRIRAGIPVVRVRTDEIRALVIAPSGPAGPRGGGIGGDGERGPVPADRRRSDPAQDRATPEGKD